MVCANDTKGRRSTSRISAVIVIALSLNIQDKTRAVRELTSTILSRSPKMCNFIEWRDKKVIYKRCDDNVMVITALFMSPIILLSS